MATSYLSLEQIFLIHDEQIESFGGSHGIRDLSLLESAIMRPQATFAGADLYKTIFEKGAAMMHSIILNHPFIDGNKRTGSVSTIIFLGMNMHLLKVGNKELVQVAIKVADEKLSVDEIASWLKKNSKKSKAQ